jgi:hypothetical protein
LATTASLYAHVLLIYVSGKFWAMWWIITKCQARFVAYTD